jgi:AmmeMemoRadiSam system protein B
VAAAADRRAPAAAGTFYPEDADELQRDVAYRLARAARNPRRHLALMAPHAGYVYSGDVAAKAFADTDVPQRVIVLAPNHTGLGKRGAVWAKGAFVLPGYEIPVDEPLCAALLDARLVFDKEAHRREHALEVELPFLRARRPDVRVTPIVLGGFDGDECVEIGQRVAAAVKKLGEEVLVVASSDMNHYLDDETTRAIDQRALEPLLKLDALGLHDRVRDEEITMCGVLPATAMLAYANARGATRAELIAYGTSADAYGDTRRCVGYASVVID